MRVLYVTSEVYPLIKTGGLADVELLFGDEEVAVETQVGDG